MLNRNIYDKRSASTAITSPTIGPGPSGTDREREEDEVRGLKETLGKVVLSLLTPCRIFYIQGKARLTVICCSGGC